MVATRGSRNSTRKRTPAPKESIPSDDDFDSSPEDSDDEDNNSMDEDDMDLIRKAKGKVITTTSRSRTNQNNKKKVSDSDSSDEDSIFQNNPPSRKTKPLPRKDKYDSSDSDSDISSVEKRRPPPKKKAPPRKKPVAQKQKSDNESDGVLDLSESDSDDDIGKMMAKTKARRPIVKRKSRRKDRSDDSSSSEDDSEDCDSDRGSSSDEEFAAVQNGKRKRFAQRFAERNKKLKLKQAAKKEAGGGEDAVGNDSDSGSDLEIEHYTTTTSKRAAARGARLDDSIEYSSDEDAKPKGPSNLKGTEEFSKAYAALLSAQKTDRAEDMNVASPEPTPRAGDSNVFRDSTKDDVIFVGNNEEGQKKSNAAQGPRIRLKLRSIEIKADGSKSEPREEECQAFGLEPMQNVLQRYRKRHNLNEGATTITMIFDGENIEWDRAPQSYDMEDDDIVEVTLRPNQGQRINVKLRNAEQEVHSFAIRTMEPLRNLMDQYIAKKKIAKRKQNKLSFQFDGEVLDLGTKPADYDMENEELIDVLMKK